MLGELPETEEVGEVEEEGGAVDQAPGHPVHPPHHPPHRAGGGGGEKEGEEEEGGQALTCAPCLDARAWLARAASRW